MERFKKGQFEDLQSCLNGPEWLIEENTFQPEKANFYETIFTVGNGYQGTRGAWEEGFKGSLPGTYIAGLFDQQDSTVVDLVSAPDWLSLKIFVDGESLNMNSCRVLRYRRVLDIKQGLLYRLTVFEDSKGRRTRYESIRFASFSDQHLCCIHGLITPENHSGRLSIESGIDGERYNLDRLPIYVDETEFPKESKWEKWAKSKHLQEVSRRADSDSVFLEMKTLDRGHHVAYASGLKILGAEAKRSCRSEYQKISEEMSFEAHQGTTYGLSKFVAIATSRKVPADKLQAFCHRKLKAARDLGLEASRLANAEVWNKKWEDCDCIVQGDAKSNLALRFNIYQLLIAANENDPKVSIGAKSLSGEGYKGHVFWDTEIFILPFFIYTQPETAKSLLLYRYHCLEAALNNAKTNGFEGAQFPWESADTGEETTPKWTHDRKTRIWTGEEELHITADISYAIITYLNATNDWQFFLDYGAEILFQTARFWVSRLEFKPVQNYFELKGVIGPDEFHEHIDNNAFTNWVVKWNLHKAVELYHQLKRNDAPGHASLVKHLDLTEEEVGQWKATADRIYLPFDAEKKIIEQFEGYFGKKEVPIIQWDENKMPLYPKGYNHDNADETTLVKQPDVVMLLYILPDVFEDEIKRINFEFYERRTMHKSSLSPGIHSIMGIEVGDTKKAVEYFLRAALVDLNDNQGNTEDGIHIASAGATWMCTVFGFGGFRVKNQQLTFKPWLPESWQELRFQLKWQGDVLSVCIRPTEAEFLLKSDEKKTLQISLFDKPVSLPSGKAKTIPFKR